MLLMYVGKNCEQILRDMQCVNELHPRCAHPKSTL